MNDKIIKTLYVGGNIAFGVYVIKKLKDMHKEIIYFEERKGVSINKKESDRIYKSK